MATLAVTATVLLASGGSRVAVAVAGCRPRRRGGADGRGRAAVRGVGGAAEPGARRGSTACCSRSASCISSGPACWSRGTGGCWTATVSPRLALDCAVLALPVVVTAAVAGIIVVTALHLARRRSPALVGCAWPARLLPRRDRSDGGEHRPGRRLVPCRAARPPWWPAPATLAMPGVRAPAGYRRRRRRPPTPPGCRCRRCCSG